ncbi:MAG: methylmalonyl-CoA epimerase [Candidatus Krumholzibacteriota bacterium]|nr:methylmalonyl-CoA epimerase [Candidatus Krumholzibacteriota bacterium]
MIKGIDHVAIAVSDLDEVLSVLENVLGITVEHREIIEGYDVEVATLKLGGTAVEVVQGTTPDSVISRFIKKRGPGMHHIALEVTNIETTIKEIGKRAEMIDESARPGKEGSRVAFIHPRSTAGVLFELVENSSGSE